MIRAGGPSVACVGLARLVMDLVWCSDPKVRPLRYTVACPLGGQAAYLAHMRKVDPRPAKTA